MSSFKMVTLDNLLTQNKQLIEINPNKEYNLVTISNKGKVKLREKKHGGLINASTGYALKAGSFIYSRLAVHTGAFGIVPAELDGALATAEMPSFIINTKQVNPEVLIKLMRMPEFISKLKMLTKGVGRVRIKEPMFLSLSIPLPPKSEQLQIAKRIGKIESRAVLLEAELAKQQQWVATLRKQVLQEAVEGKLTAGWRKSHKCESATHWETVEVGTVITTITPPAKIPKNQFGNAGKYPIVDQSQNYIAGWCDDEKATVKSEKPLLIFGDHTCAIKYFERAFVQGADGIKILKTRDDVLPKYLYYLLKGNAMETEGYKRHFAKLKKLKTCLPPLDEQARIVTRIEKMLPLCDKLEAEITATRAHATHLMQATLKEAFTPPA